jgi:hypothetical protein
MAPTDMARKEANRGERALTRVRLEQAELPPLAHWLTGARGGPRPAGLRQSARPPARPADPVRWPLATRRDPRW